jgi:hypothetical protein
MAVNQPTAEQDELAAILIEVALGLAGHIAQRQAVLARALSHS